MKLSKHEKQDPVLSRHLRHKWRSTECSPAWKRGKQLSTEVLGPTESLPAGLNCESHGGFDEGTAGAGLFWRAQCPRGCLWNQGPKRNFNGLGILRKPQLPYGCINEQFKIAGKAASGCVEVWNGRPCHPSTIGGEATERRVAVVLDLRSAVGEINREGPGVLETDLPAGFP